MKPEFYGEVRKGKFYLNDRDTFDKYIASLEGKELKLIVKRASSGDTARLHRYYRGLVLPIFADYFGFDQRSIAEMEALHAYIMKERTGRTILGKDGLRRLVWDSMADYDKYELFHCIEDIRRWGLMDYSLITPNPDPELRKKFEQKDIDQA